jgi:hypothetical protein
MPLTKRMAASGSVRLDGVLSNTASMPLLQISLAATAAVTLIIICHRRVFEEIVQAKTWLHSNTGDRRADGITALSPKRETGTAALSRRYGETCDPNLSRQCEPMWIGAQGFLESVRAVLLEEDVRWGARLSHTWCEPCLLGLAIEAKILPKRELSVQHVDGLCRAPQRAAAPRSPIPSERESHKDFAVTPCRDNIPTRFLPHRSIHDSRQKSNRQDDGGSQ